MVNLDLPQWMMTLRSLPASTLLWWKIVAAVAVAEVVGGDQSGEEAEAALGDPGGRRSLKCE